MFRAIAILLLAVPLLPAQPKIGIIEVFGARKITPEKLKRALNIAEGAALPQSKGDAEDKLISMDDVVHADIEAVCCDQGKAILYIGIEERGGVRYEARTPPTNEELKLPDEIRNEWLEFITSVETLARKGDDREDLTKGYSLMADADVRHSQEQFLKLADQHFALLREVLRNAADEEQRGIAAYMIGYGPDRKAVASELQFAMQDPDSTVRNNAMRGLMALTVWSRLNPDSGLRISPTWFVEMLHSTHFTDRSKAAAALYTFTENRDQAILGHLKERAMPSLIEMAQWRHLPHALPAFYLLGRVAGLPEAEIQELWKKGDRAELIRRAKPAPRK
jgi:hypothetical protein